MTGLHRYLCTAVFLAFTLSAASQSPNAQPLKGQPVAAQALINTSWRAFYKPLTDTVTLRFSKDSSFMTSSLGVPILLSTIKTKNDLIVFRDYGGLNACADMQGSYHIKIDSDT